MTIRCWCFRYVQQNIVLWSHNNSVYEFVSQIRVVLYVKYEMLQSLTVSSTTTSRTIEQRDSVEVPL